MKVDDNTVTFRFCFRGLASKTESLLTLRAFLHDKEWLPVVSDYDPNLLEYHSENDGTCDVILKKVVDTSMAAIGQSQRLHYKNPTGDGFPILASFSILGDSNLVSHDINSPQKVTINVDGGVRQVIPDGTTVVLANAGGPRPYMLEPGSYLIFQYR